MTLLLAFCGAAALSGCATPVKYKADANLIGRDGTRRDDRTDFPYVARYRDGEKRLSYIAARRRESETMALLEKEFSSQRPQAVVIQGYPSSMGFSPKDFVAPLEDLPKGEIIGTGDAMALAAWLAIKAGIPFIGGEPKGAIIMEKLRKQGFTRDDVIGFRILRRIPGWKEDRVNVGENDFTRVFDKGNVGENEFARLLDYVYRTSPEWNFQDASSMLMSERQFARWYAGRAKKDLHFDQIRPAEVAAGEGPASTFFNHIAAKFDAVRDENAVETIAMCLNRFDRVLVVYAGGRYLGQKSALEGMLGSPGEYFKDAP